MQTDHSRHEIWLFLYEEYREDEEKQANFLSKEASQFILEMTTSFTNAAMVTEI